MFKKSKQLAALLPLFFIMLSAPANATMVRKMDLAQLCEAADRIFRGTVVDIDKGSVAAGGGDIPTITYTIDVSEQFKGAFTIAKSGAATVLITIADVPLIETPRLSVGQDYLLLTTAPSRAGLSTMVGLGQGTFRIFGDSNAEMTVNGLNNAGLVNGRRGAVPYSDMAKRIRSTL